VSAETELQTLLEAYAPLTALVGDRIAQNAIDQGEAVPYVVYTSQHRPDYGLNNNILANNVQLRIECWAGSAEAADDIADAVRAALLADGVVCTSRVTGHDADTALDATILVADWWE
jgi:Protein of unknown function (DUF3168)